MKYFYTLLLVLVCFGLNAQRVFISENVSQFNSTIFQVTDQSAKVSWEIYMTDNLNPSRAGNWKQMNSSDSAVFVFKRVNSRQAAMFTYRIIEDSTKTNFRYSDNRSDILFPVSYMLVDKISEANVVICLTPNKWIADAVIYKSNKEFNVNKAHWRFVRREEEETIKVFITTNRTFADLLVHFTENPLEAQIR